MTRSALPLVLAALLAFGCAEVPPEPKPAAPAKAACAPAPSELVVKDLQPGTGDTARFRSAVLVSYTGWLYDGCKPDFKGAQFDTSEGRVTPFGFVLGAGRVIRGWDQGVIGMKEQGKRLLIVPPQMGYGAAGAPPKIPPNATLVFEVTLEKILQQPQ